MIEIEDLDRLGFCLPKPSFRTYVLKCKKGSISVNYRRDTLRLGGCTGGRAFLIKLKSATHLEVILNALLDDEMQYHSVLGGIIGGRQLTHELK